MREKFQWRLILRDGGSNKDVSVAVMKRLGWGVGGEGWWWPRRLFAREKRG
ncbi:hypothetical protein A2U01_0073133, partial [Trifolium medium]|nr:hypothetical protein [Trifolium medium]